MANSLLKEGIIKEDEIEIVRFGLESMEGNLLGFIMALSIGVFFGRMGDAVLLWGLMFPLRKNAGGFHASTKTGCFLITALMLLISFTLFTVCANTIILYGSSVLVSGVVIWVLAPLGNPSKELDETEHKIYRIRCRGILILESVGFIAACCLKWKIMIRGTAMAFFIVGISLLMGEIKLLICSKNELK